VTSARPIALVIRVDQALDIAATDRETLRPIASEQGFDRIVGFGARGPRLGPAARAIESRRKTRPTQIRRAWAQKWHGMMRCIPQTAFSDFGIPPIFG
jgi:hypothetical protein